MEAMTLDEHQIQGLPKLECKTLPASSFELLMQNAGYFQIGTAPEERK